MKTDDELRARAMEYAYVVMTDKNKFDWLGRIAYNLLAFAKEVSAESAWSIRQAAKKPVFSEIEMLLREHLEGAQAEVPPVPDTQRSLYRKYYVMRLNDPAGKHDDCEYFVLDLRHDKFSAPALIAYAESCKKEYPVLASSLLDKAEAIERAASLPADVRVVPVDPTEEMIQAAWNLAAPDSVEYKPAPAFASAITKAYKAMIGSAK